MQVHCALAHCACLCLVVCGIAQILLEYRGQKLGVLEVESKWVPYKAKETRLAYGVSSLEHPGETGTRTYVHVRTHAHTHTCPLTAEPHGIRTCPLIAERNAITGAVCVCVYVCVQV